MAITTFAVDDGYAYTKVAWMGEDGSLQTRVVPSLAASGLQMTGFDGDSSGGYRTDNQEYTVSSAVSRPMSTEFSGYPFSAMNRAIVHHALWRTEQVSPDVPLEIGLSIPMAIFYNPNREQRDDIQKRRAASFAIPVFPDQVLAGDAAKPHSLEFTSVRVYPEAASAYIDYRLDHRGESSENPEGPVAIVDIGGHTTDIAVMLENFQIDQSQSGTDELGVLKLLRMIEREAEQHYHLTPYAGMAEKVLRHPNHEVRVRAEMINMTEIVNRAKQRLAAEIYQAVEHRIGGADAMVAVVFVGGGAEVLGSVLKSYPHTRVPPEPQLANVRGMLKYMTYLR